jgi:hypothetical protein
MDGWDRKKESGDEIPNSRFERRRRGQILGLVD